MRILLVIDTLDVGGAERHTVNLAVALHRRGHLVAVACGATTRPTDGGELNRELNAVGIPVHRLLRRPVKRRLSVRYAWKLRRLLKGAPVDIVHAHCFASMVAAGVATWRTPAALVLTEHSEATWQARATHYLNRRLHRRARGLIAVSASIAERFNVQACRSQPAMTVIHNAIPSVNESLDSCPIRRLAGKSPSTEPASVGKARHPLVGMITRLQPEKGVHVFLAALSLLPEVHGLILGDGPERASLEQLARHLGIETRVCFLPEMVQADETLHRLDILAVPSLTEGTPLVVLEAMAGGIPVVASRVGGIPELIVHHEHGILVTAGDATALAAGISVLLADKELAQRFATAAQARASACFSFPAMVSATELVYRRAIEQVEA